MKCRPGPRLILFGDCVYEERLIIEVPEFKKRVL